jgi:hypothetical protein
MNLSHILDQKERESKAKPQQTRSRVSALVLAQKKTARTVKLFVPGGQ